MKKSTITIALALSLASAVVAADNTTLLSLENTDSLIQISDHDLATVKGSGWGWGRGDQCYFCSNTANASQLNLSLGSLGILQGNNSMIQQANN